MHDINDTIMILRMYVYDTIYVTEECDDTIILMTIQNRLIIRNHLNIIQK